jgi:D-glycero-D-manno-heptose 1,7-bisphosphate phosphatase
MGIPAVFLDRDGVLIEDVDLLTVPTQIHILKGVPKALLNLKKSGFKFIIISNQPVVARGMINEEEVNKLQKEINRQLIEAGAPVIDAFYFCPHHPKAALPEYRINCECRKPKPGLIFNAARDHDINLSLSFMIGDRITDIIAGFRAGCRTIQVQTGKHLAPPINTSEPIDITIKPDHISPDLPAAAHWILEAE